MLKSESYNLSLINNCFNDKNARHMGIKYNGNWYIITHRNKGIYVPKNCIKTNKPDDRASYLVKLVKGQSAPNILTPLSARIHKTLIENYDEILNGKIRLNN